MIGKIKKKILNNEDISRQEALLLYEAPLAKLCTAADEIRQYFCGNTFDLCTIINAKSGKCSENCKYCAQSAYYSTNTLEYPLLDTKELVKHARYNDKAGVLRYSIVTSGKSIGDTELALLCKGIHEIKDKTSIQVCASLGLLSEKQFKKLKEAGVSRVHNNLETSRSKFPDVCTTHTYEDKINAVRAAKRAGLSVCSGGIMGLGETKEDRIDMALTLRELEVKSVPINILNPIPGTPFENRIPLTVDEVCRIIAVYRFILPSASIRLAGGRGLLPDKGRACFVSGANATISGDMLTTAGITIKNDMALLKELNYKIQAPLI